MGWRRLPILYTVEHTLRSHKSSLSRTTSRHTASHVEGVGFCLVVYDTLLLSREDTLLSDWKISLNSFANGLTEIVQRVSVLLVQTRKSGIKTRLKTQTGLSCRKRHWQTPSTTTRFKGVNILPSWLSSFHDRWSLTPSLEVDVWYPHDKI